MYIIGEVLVLAPFLLSVVSPQANDRNGESYLMKYGYLPMRDLELGQYQVRSNEDIKRAIRTLQQFAHLPVTGELDAQTLEVMDKERCGVSDMLERSRRKKRYILGPSKWSHNDLSFRYYYYSRDMNQTTIRQTLDRAFKIWSRVTPLTFKEKFTGSTDIGIQFASGYHGDGYIFDGPGMTLAHAFFPGEDKGGDIHFDDDETWTLNSDKGTDLFVVAVHEIGHALGLAHSSVADSIMYPWYKGSEQALQLHTDDITAIQSLYGEYKSAEQPSNDNPGPVPTQSSLPSQTTTTVSMTTTTRRRVYWSDNEAPDLCNGSIDALTIFRKELFIFKGKYFWRMRSDGDDIGPPGKINTFWYGLPKELDHVDAVYERPTDQSLVFFAGQRYWVYSSNHMEPGFPSGGRLLRELGLPDDIQHIDAAFVWGYNKKTYLVSGDMYWRYDELAKSMDFGYPRDMSMWEGVPLPVDDALMSWDGETYFFKGEHYWKFKDIRMSVYRDYPKLMGPEWFSCPSMLKQKLLVDDPVFLTSSQLVLSHFLIIILVILRV